MDVLGVRIDNFSKREILAKIEVFFNEPGFHQIATVNPEFILRAQGDAEFKKIINNCDLNIADGIGIKYAFLRYGRWLKTRFAGADLTLDILRIAEKKGIGVFLAINKDGLSDFEEIGDALLKLFPKLKIDGADLDPSGANYQLQISGCSVLLCNFGAPFQEKFISSQKNGTILLGMGVGGSFDFLTGKAKRAPLFFRRIGLEWLWRVFVRPADKNRRFAFRIRLGRIVDAVIIFPLKVIIDKNR